MLRSRKDALSAHGAQPGVAQQFDSALVMEAGRGVSTRLVWNVYIHVEAR